MTTSDTPALACVKLQSACCAKRAPAMRVGKICPARLRHAMQNASSPSQPVPAARANGKQPRGHGKWGKTRQQNHGITFMHTCKHQRPTVSVWGNARLSRPPGGGTFPGSAGGFPPASPAAIARRPYQSSHQRGRFLTRTCSAATPWC